VTYASEICLEERGQSIRELPPASPDKDHDYFAAWGRFASVDKIPDYFTLSIPDGSKAGRLQRESSRIDHVFVIEHRWEETLADIVTFADMRTARRELAQLLIQVFEDVLKQWLDSQYDVSALIDWLRGEGTACWEETCDLYFFLSTNSPRSDELQKRFGHELGRLFTRRGLTITGKNGMLLDHDLVDAAIMRFVKDK